MAWLSSLPETENRQEDSDERDLWQVKTKGCAQRGMRREIEGGREGIVDGGRDELSLEECRGSFLSSSALRSTGIESCRWGGITVWNGSDETNHTHSLTQYIFMED